MSSTIPRSADGDRMEKEEDEEVRNHVDMKNIKNGKYERTYGSLDEDLWKKPIKLAMPDRKMGSQVKDCGLHLILKLYDCDKIVQSTFPTDVQLRAMAIEKLNGKHPGLSGITPKDIEKQMKRLKKDVYDNRTTNVGHRSLREHLQMLAPENIPEVSENSPQTLYNEYAAQLLYLININQCNSYPHILLRYIGTLCKFSISEGYLSFRSVFQVLWQHIIKLKSSFYMRLTVRILLRNVKINMKSRIMYLQIERDLKKSQLSLLGCYDHFTMSILTQENTPIKDQIYNYNYQILLRSYSAFETEMNYTKLNYRGNGNTRSNGRLRSLHPVPSAVNDKDPTDQLITTTSTEDRTVKNNDTFYQTFLTSGFGNKNSGSSSSTSSRFFAPPIPKPWSPEISGTILLSSVIPDHTSENKNESENHKEEDTDEEYFSEGYEDEYDEI